MFAVLALVLPVVVLTTTSSSNASSGSIGSIATLHRFFSLALSKFSRAPLLLIEHDHEARTGAPRHARQALEIQASRNSRGRTV